MTLEEVTVNQRWVASMPDKTQVGMDWLRETGNEGLIIAKPSTPRPWRRSPKTQALAGSSRCQTMSSQSAWPLIQFHHAHMSQPATKQEIDSAIAELKIYREAHRDELRAYKGAYREARRKELCVKQSMYAKTPQGKATRSAYKKKMPPAVLRSILQSSVNERALPSTSNKRGKYTHMSNDMTAKRRSRASMDAGQKSTGATLGNLDASDVKPPEVKLLQATSPECAEQPGAQGPARSG